MTTPTIFTGTPLPTGRRDFLKTTSAAALVSSTLAFPTVLRGAPNTNKLKIGLVGAGGRGTGAASDALRADANCALTAVGDIFAGQIENSVHQLQNQFAERVNVPESQRFVGLDAYKKVIDSGVDVVLLCTPPGFRPLHFAYAVEAGKHIFCEKPVAVDPVGVRSVMASVAKAKAKELKILAGFCWRYCHSRRRLFEAVLNGAIGDVTAYYATYYTSPVKPMAPASARRPEWSDIEWQLRNWYNFSWLSGDGYVEQCIHSVDKVAWAFREQPPLSCVATGGRQSPTEGGNIFDHMTAVYEYPGGVFATVGQRQIPNCHNENADYIHGTKGTATIGRTVAIRGENSQRFSEEEDNMYVQEHREFFAAIRSGEPFNDGDRMATSTLLGLMGRMAAYTGKKVTWEQILNSNEDLAPEETFTWESSFTPIDTPIPGKYPLL